MTGFFKVAVVALALTTACLAQEPLVAVSSKGKQKWPVAEVDKIYLSACSAVQQEFSGNRTVGPRITLLLGADKDGIDFDKREIQLVRWDRVLFAQGVVAVAFSDLMPAQRRITIAKRSLRWADATIEVAQTAK